MNQALLLWQFLSGKKLVIGAVLMLAAEFIQKVLIPEWGITGSWAHSLQVTFEWAGDTIAIGGLTHKGVKLIQEKSTTKAVTPADPPTP
jgi:hypothetical protein